MREEIYFTVFGDPAPQGSKRYVGNGVMIEASKKIQPWRKAVADAASLTFEASGDDRPFADPVEVWVTFYLRRPKSVRRLFPHTPPDVDKLERGLFDALTKAKVWNDDSLAVRVHTAKIYADTHEPGCAIAIRKVSDEPRAVSYFVADPVDRFVTKKKQ